MHIPWVSLSVQSTTRAHRGYLSLKRILGGQEAALPRSHMTVLISSKNICSCYTDRTYKTGLIRAWDPYQGSAHSYCEIVMFYIKTFIAGMFKQKMTVLQLSLALCLKMMMMSSSAKSSCRLVDFLSASR